MYANNYIQFTKWFCYDLKLSKMLISLLTSKQSVINKSSNNNDNYMFTILYQVQ